MDAWTRLARLLDERAAAAPPPPTQGRHGAALALLRPLAGDDLEIVYTRRRDDLSTHPGQISFPGGRVDPGETIEDAALRETAEECALDVGTATVLGVLPAFYIPPSRFWLQVVVARWDAPHDLAPAEAEVAEILRVRLSTLRDPARRRVVRLSARGSSWAWELDGGHLLWGATAIATAVLLDLVAPGWADGMTPESMPVHLERRPWEGAPAGAGPRRAHLPDVPSVPADALPGVPADVEAAAVVGPVAAGVASALSALHAAASGPLVVLAGPGWTGTVGLLAAAALAEGGVDVAVRLVAGERSPSPARADALARLGDRAAPLGAGGAGRAALSDAAPDAGDGVLPGAGLVVDAIVGRGLRGTLGGPALEAVVALQGTAARIAAVDVPSGLDPQRGIIGEAVSADVTLALGAPAPGLLASGSAAFVGDLYVVTIESAVAGAADPLVRVLPAASGGWSE